jgi:hypothetical protein
MKQSYLHHADANKRTHALERRRTISLQDSGVKSHRQGRGVRGSGVMREIHGLVLGVRKNLNSGAFPQSRSFSSSPQSVVRRELLL